MKYARLHAGGASHARRAMRAGVRMGLVVLGVGLIAISGSPQARAKGREDVAPLSTPAGITLQPLGKYQGYGLDQETAALTGHGRIAFADSRGMTLYTYARDTDGRSHCTGECELAWRPLIAQRGAKPVPRWSLIKRQDGSRQWALDGKPLYTFTGDSDPGSVGGNSPKRYGRGEHIGERGAALTEIAPDKPLPPDWSPALQYPVTAVLPPDIAVREVEDAAGLVLVNSANRSLYVFLGRSEGPQPCPTPCAWKPVGAPRLAVPIGDFAPATRSDGVRQWTYKKKGLYTFDGDLLPGDANGEGLSKDLQVAYYARNFMPRDVSFQESFRLGKILARGNGQSLYRRDSYIFQSGSGHGQRRGVLIRPAVGRDLGTDPRCDQACEKWHPFLAPSDAQPQGFWDVYTRSDGRKQWAYQGYALWTFDGDRKPGDVNANDSWRVFQPTPKGGRLDIGTPYDAVAALYWAVAVP